MFVELNDLRCVIVRVPVGKQAIDLQACAKLPPRIRCAYLVDGPPPPSLPRGAGNLVVPWDDAYLFPVQANIKHALTAADAQPYEAVYVTFDAREIRGAAQTRVGTVLVGGQAMDEALPDVMADNIVDAVRMLANFVPNSFPGYFGEVSTTIDGSGRSAGRLGIPVMLSRPLREDIATASRAIALGRYFPEGEARHTGHQPTRRLLNLKRGLADVAGEPFAGSLAVALLWLDGKYPFEAITRVPQRPNDRRPDSIAALVREACRLGDSKAGRPLTPRFRPDLLSCVRDYPPQKQAGSLDSRRANVEGAFRCPGGVKGKHVVLIDDILTTGSTAAECAATLLAAGASFVTALVLAKNQRVITPVDMRGAPCTAPGCDGHFVVRVKRRDRSNTGFWGCSNFPNCHQTRPWEPGRIERNRRNVRDMLDDDPDVPF